jgi:threonine dehydrogenase-like Zn-dependent dehydrogenase
MINLRNRGWADPAELVTHKLGFSGVQQAYDMYEQRQDEIIKVVMDISK